MGKEKTTINLIRMIYSKSKIFLQMYLKIFLLKPLKEWRFFQLFLAGSCNVEDILLTRFHS